MISFLLELFLGGFQSTELLVLSLQVVLSQVTLLGLLLDLQCQVLHLKEQNELNKSFLLASALFSLSFYPISDMTLFTLAAEVAPVGDI